MAHFIKNMIINPNTTVGVFATLGATIAASNIHIIVPSGANVGVVHDSTGVAPVFPVPNAPFTVGAAEVWIKNSGTAAVTLPVRLFNVA